MNWDIARRQWGNRLLAASAVLLVFAAVGKVHAFNPVNFTAVKHTLTNEIATLEQDPGANARRLRVSRQANGVLDRNPSSISDGRVLAALLSRLKGASFSDYAAPLETAAGNLQANFAKAYQFAGSLLLEIPNPRAARSAQVRYNALAPLSARLINAQRPAQVAKLYDSASARVSGLIGYISKALVVPIPANLPRDTVSANINGVNFRSSASQSTENDFSATLTESNVIVLSVRAVDGTLSDATARRAITLEIPAVQQGTVRYAIGENAELGYHVGIFSPSETIIQATSGSIFVSANGDEIWGIFNVSGDGLNIADGRFRFTVTNP